MALVLPILIGTAGLASQGAWWLHVHQTMQNAADSAALSAAAALSRGADPTTQANAITSAYCALPGNSSTCFVNGQNNVTVTTTVNASAKSVEVTVAQQPLLSSTSLSVSKNISAGAAAMYLPIAMPNSNTDTTITCILALATTGTGISFVGNNLNIQMTGCSLFSNSTSTGAIASILVTGDKNSITASTIGTVGQVCSQHSAACPSAGNNNSLSPKPTVGAPSVPDPYQGLATTWPSSCSGCATPTVPPSCAIGSCTLGPGVYSTDVVLSASGATYTLNPGVYYLQGNLNISGQNITVNGSGVTLVLGGNSSIDATNATNLTINITAPTTGWNAGIAIWDTKQTGSNANALANPSSTVNINGVIYTPHASLSFQGNTPSPTCTQIVAQQVSLSGNISLQGDGFNCPHILVSLK
jgi:Flp pilus assembly protein TadG